MTTRRIGASAVAGTLLAVGLAAAPSAAAGPPPSGADGSSLGCIVDEGNRDATVEALKYHCSSEEIMALFESAPVGEAPTGTKTITLLPVFQLGGRVVGYDNAQALSTAQNELGKSLTFTTTPAGDPWVHKNYVWGDDAGGPFEPGTSRIDGGPAWTANFERDFGGVPISIHEYRQLTPDVWIGRDIGGGSPERSSGPTGGAFVLS